MRGSGQFPCDRYSWTYQRGRKLRKLSDHILETCFLLGDRLGNHFSHSMYHIEQGFETRHR